MCVCEYVGWGKARGGGGRRRLFLGGWWDGGERRACVSVVGLIKGRSVPSERESARLSSPYLPITIHIYDRHPYQEGSCWR